MMLQSRFLLSGVVSSRRVISMRMFAQLTKTSSSSAQLSQGVVLASALREEEEDNPSALVDNLIQHTRHLMQGRDWHVVAFSGGVDSSLVLALLQRASSQSDQIQPVLGISPAVPLEQIQLARQVSLHLGIELKEIRTTEGTDAVYIANEGQACLACKTHLYTGLKLVLDHASQKHARSAKTDCNSGALYNGTNADDTKDPTRVGLIAAANFRVLSPLENTSKRNVRLAAKHLGLPNWNYAASPCLRSRLALGMQATQHHLNMIERAERIVKLTLRGYKETSNLRVRMLSSLRSRVEIDEDLMEDANDLIPIWSQSFQELGFSSVQVSAFRSGSVSRQLP